jgi:hypothetical protein
MKKFILTSLFLFILIQTGFSGSDKKGSKFDFTGPRNPSLIRGFDYNPANGVAPRHHIDWWINYDSSTVDFDLDLAKSLNLNQTRVFVPYEVYKEDSEDLPEKLRQFIHECQKRDIGVMIVVGSGPWVNDTILRPEGRKWAKFLVDAISNEPGLRFWDVMNEPDWPPSPKELVARKFANAKFMANTFHELDPSTPVTIGMAFVDGMIELADYVDVLQFHDYSPTREQIRNNIERAKEFAAKVHKPLIDGEIGCVARANPYDIALKEHTKAKVGWYIWELMIVPKGWGPVQGVFYADGTVRDPSIPAAIMGFFRKRSADILPSVPDREGWVTRIIDRSNKWLNDTNRTWKDGLDIAEIEANLLESAQLTAMRISPTYEVEMLRKGEVNFKDLIELIIKFQGILKPYELPQKKN